MAARCFVFFKPSKRQDPSFFGVQKTGVSGISNDRRRNVLLRYILAKFSKNCNGKKDADLVENGISG